MLDIKLLREEPEKVKKAIKLKGADPKIVDDFLKLDSSWRKITGELENFRREQKELSEKKNISAAKEVKEKIKIKENELSGLEGERLSIWFGIPNLSSDDTPVGEDESFNKFLRSWGEPRKFDFTPKDHLELGEALGIIDTKKASEVSGTRFNYLKGGAALLEFALVRHGFKVLGDEKILKNIADKIKPGYNPKPFMPVVPPVFIKPDVYRRMARLEPTEERYYIPSDDIYLIGSAEHTLGPIHMDETLKESELPIRYIGFSTAFRREAGSYGKDVKGILRVHQFDKLEMESFTLPEDSFDEQEFIVGVQEYLMQSLELPYQIIICSTGDQGGPDFRHLDLETWMPAQNKYRETHSADLMNDYQSRRLNTKVRRENGETQFVHMNDATAFAIGRTLIAILENYQTKDGKIEVPKVLQEYVGQKIIG
ncbi:MAG TPA: serine--tRNA ligase [Candidatus Paceibacterota bacterium]|nr:serine--tRNA ligase [Candidatus Paceibacterota bacterium]